MIKYAKHVSRSEEIVMAPATAQLVQLTISSELARRQGVPVPDMLSAAQIVVEAGRSFTMAAEDEAARLSPDCSRKVRRLTKDLDLAGSDLISVSNALRTDQSVALRTALRDACFQYNLLVMKILLSLDGQKIEMIKRCGEQLVAEIHSIPQTSGNMKTLVPLFKHFIEDLTQFCYRITDYQKEIKDKNTRATIENGLKILKRTPTVISNILQDKVRRYTIQTDLQLAGNIKTFVDTVKVMLTVLKSVDVDSATRYLELVLHASIAVAGEAGPKRRNVIMSTCSKIIKIRSELAKLFSVTSQSSQSWNHINSLSNRLGEEFSELNRILSQTYKSSNQHVEESRPLLNLRSAAARKQNSYIVDEDPQLKNYIERFKQHANRLIDITEYAVKMCKNEDANIVILQNIAADISVLCPKIIASALSVHIHPDENITLSFLNAMCSEWSKVVTKLLSIIDTLTNTGDFMKASEKHINQDMALSKKALIDQDATALHKAAKAIINRAQRVYHVGQKELLKSTSETFSLHLEEALTDLEHLLPKILSLTHGSLDNDHNQQEELAIVAQKIAKAVHRVKTVVCECDGDEVNTQVDAAKRLASALRGESGFFDIGIQTNPESISTNQTNSEPDILLQFAMKDDSLDPDDINKLVGVKGIRKPPASIKDAIITLADLITTAMSGDPVESCITILAAHCGRIKDLSQKCRDLTDNDVRLRTIDFLVKEMNKLTPSVNDAARKTSTNTKDATAIENLRWSARHWADSVIVLGKAFDDFGLGPSANQFENVAPSLKGLISAASAGDNELTKAELDSLSLRTTKQCDLANYCSAACLSSTIAQKIDSTSQDLENVFSEMSRTALALADCSDSVTQSHLEHVCDEWRELYQELCNLVSDNQPDTMPNESELGIPPSKVNTAIQQLISVAKAGDRPKVQVLGNSLSAMATKMRRISKPYAESKECPDYEKSYINEVNEELLNITPEVIKYGLLVAADTNNKRLHSKLDHRGRDWIDRMISLSNVLEMIPDGMEIKQQENMEITESQSKTESDSKTFENKPIQFPEDLHEPIKAAGFRLSRQSCVSEEGSELKDIKSVTTKLCDCLQVLSTTHHNVNERYEMEDDIENVKSAVNQIFLMREGELHANAEEWVSCVSRVTQHLDKFLCEILCLVGSPKDKDNFSSAPERITNMLKSVTEITDKLKLALDQGLGDEEKEDLTLVTVTHSHVAKLTPLLCDAIHVVSNRPNDTLQRTKFEVIKYQWAAKFKLLTIAMDDMLGQFCIFPDTKDQEGATILSKKLDYLINSVSLISEDLQDQEYSDLVDSQIAKLREIRDALPLMHTLRLYSDYLKIKTDTCFAVYCVRRAILTICQNIDGNIPNMSLSMVDDSTLSFDPVKVSDNADDTIDMIENIVNKVVSSCSAETAKELNDLSSELVEMLVLISDHPNKEMMFEYQFKYMGWLCKVKDIVSSNANVGMSNILLILDNNKLPELSVVSQTAHGTEDNIMMEKGDISNLNCHNNMLLTDEESSNRLDPYNCSTTFRSEMSGSQTFSELHFSDNEEPRDRTPEPTFDEIYEDVEISELNKAAPLNYSSDINLTEENEEEFSDSSSSLPGMLEPLAMEYTDNPTQIAEVKDITSVFSDCESTVDLLSNKLADTKPGFATSIKVLENELDPWDKEQNKLLKVTDMLLHQFRLIRDTVLTDPENSRSCVELIEAATTITDIIQDMVVVTRDVIAHSTHRVCNTDLEYCTDTLPTLAKQLMITCTLVSSNLQGVETEGVISKHVTSITDCVVKLVHSVYHVHLSGALDYLALSDTLLWRGVDCSSDSDSVLV